MTKDRSQKQVSMPAPGFEKLYYSIGEVATMLNVNTSLIRYWEEQFELLQPKRNRKGNRLYTQEEISRLQLIYHLLKEKGYTLKGAREALRHDKARLIREREVVNRLEGIKKSLLEIRNQLLPDDDQ